MRLHRQELMQRRQVLQAKIAGQRDDLVGAAQRWQPVLTVADQTVAGVRFLRRNAVLVGGLAALAIMRRNGVSALVTGGWRVWKAYRYLSTLSNKNITGR